MTASSIRFDAQLGSEAVTQSPPRHTHLPIPTHPPISFPSATPPSTAGRFGKSPPQFFPSFSKLYAGNYPLPRVHSGKVNRCIYPQGPRRKVGLVGGTFVLAEKLRAGPLWTWSAL